MISSREEGEFGYEKRSVGANAILKPKADLIPFFEPIS